MFSQQHRNDILEKQWQGGECATNAYRKRLKEIVKPGMTLLHAGCGWDKKDISANFKDNCKIIGVDLDERVKEMFHSEFHLCSMNTMPFEEATFDVIFSEYVLEHVEEPEGAFKEMSRVLKPGGTIVILTPNLYSYKSLGSLITPYEFHLWMGCIRYGDGHQPDMYKTTYKANTAKDYQRLASQSGLTVSHIQWINNGPTWFSKCPVVFDLANGFHHLTNQVEWLKTLRCGLIIEITK